MKEKDASFTSLQDKEQKVCGFLHWLLDAIDLNNTDLQQKATKAPKTQLDHAIQALSEEVVCNYEQVRELRFETAFSVCILRFASYIFQNLPLAKNDFSKRIHKVDLQL